MNTRILLLLFAGIFSFSAFSQVCTINYSVSGTGIYPDTLPDATVGQAYDTDVTFFMPLDTMGYDFTNFHIQSVSLPVGMTWDCSNNMSDCNYNPQVSQYGCVNIAGTPLLAGIYNVEVQVIADLTVIQGYPFSFQIYLEVLPADVNTTNDGFSMLGASGCMPVTVEFTNNNPGLLAYSWDFGNGNTSNNENPGPQLYTVPGDYVVHYEAYNTTSNIDVYTLTSVDVTAMSNFGGGFPSFENADPYFILKENGTPIYQSTFYLDQNPPVSWPTSILLNPLNTYVFEIWEADDTAGEFYLFEDDYMGEHTLNLAGCTGCTAGTSTINYTINHQVIYPSPVVISADTVHVYGYPAVPEISFDEQTQVMSTPDLGVSYQWFLDGNPIGGATGSEHTITVSGTYSVAAINSQGCLTESVTLDAIYCNPTINPVVSMSGTGGFVFVTGFPDDYEISWELNGIPVNGEVNDTLYTTQAGTYSATVSNSEGCSYTTPLFGANLSIEEAGLFSWNIYPNPANEVLFVELNGLQKMDAIQLVDLSGRLIKEWNAIDQTKNQLDIAEIPSGYFILKLVSGTKNWSKKLIVE